MADSKRHKIVTAIVDRMKLINGAGDYTTNVANRVKDNEANWSQEQGTLPAITVFDGDSNANPTSTGQPTSTIHDMSVLIRGFTTSSTSAINARNLIKDIMTAIRQDTKWTVSGTKLAMQTRPVRDGIVRTDAETFEVEGCEVEIMVQFITEYFNAEA